VRYWLPCAWASAPGRRPRRSGPPDPIYASASIDKLSDRARIAEATATLMAVPTKLTAPR